MADVITIAVEGVKPQCSMLQQFGRCYCQVVDEMATTGCFMYTGRCYYQVADGIATWPVTKDFTPQGQGPPNSMGYPRSIKKGFHWGP